MPKVKPISQSVRLALWGGAIAASMSVVAQPALAQSADGEQSTNRVEVTGSSIKRIAREGALPVQTLNRQDIERTGASSVTELMQKLPTMQNFTEVSQSVGGGGGGISTANIHGIGDSRTLVLINGRRLAAYGLQTLTGGLAAIDLNTLPISAIERVEVLTDGASAIYGSDAIAGVVNFITRRDVSGIEVSVSEFNPKSGAKEKKFSITGGIGNKEKDGYNVLFSYSNETRSELKATDRSFAKTGIMNWSEGGNDYEFFNGSSRSIPANVRIGSGLRNPYLSTNGACPPAHVQLGQGCYFDYTTTVYIYPQTKRDTFLVSGELVLNQNHSLFADFLYGEQTTVAKIAPPPVDIPVRTTDPAFSYAAALGATGNVTARWRVMDAGNRTTEFVNKAYQFAFGSKGKIADWDYQASFTRSESKATESHLAGWLKANELDAALASGTLNPFVQQGNQSAAGMAALNSAVHRGLYKSGTNAIDIFEVRGSRPIFKMAGGDAMLGAGVDYRIEKTKYSPSSLAQGVGNNIAGDSAEDVPFNVRRTSVGAFAELAAPISKNLELTGAVRYDKYSDFGDTINTKVSARWQPTREVLVRGSFGTGFRAPTPAQVKGPTQQLYGVTSGTFDCPFTGADPLAVYCPPPASQYNTYAGSNANLKPEKSQQWTIGARVEPTNWLSAGFDIWNVDLKDRIGQLSEDTIMADPVTYRGNFTTYTDPLSKETLLAILQKNQNMGNLQSQGIDFDVRTRFNTGLGRVTSSVLATYMLKNEYQRITGGDYFSDLGKYNDGGVTIRFIARWINTLQTGNWNHSFTVNYKAGYKDQPQTVENLTTGATVENYTRDVQAFVTADWQTGYSFKFKGSTLRANVGLLNIFNQKPPFSIKTAGGHQLGYDNRYADPRGRTWYATVSAKF